MKIMIRLPKTWFTRWTVSHNLKIMTMRTKRILKYAGIAFISLAYTACTGPYLSQKVENKKTPDEFYNSADTINTAKIKWKEFFTDPYLTTLIDTALRNNQEFNILLQEINIANNEVRARK